MTAFQEELIKLSEAVDKFSMAMKRRLAEKVKAGYTGWDDDEKVSDNALVADLRSDAINHPEKHLVDIANRAMMLWYRDQLRR